MRYLKPISLSVLLMCSTAYASENFGEEKDNSKKNFSSKMFNVIDHDPLSLMTESEEDLEKLKKKMDLIGSIASIRKKIQLDDLSLDDKKSEVSYKKDERINKIQNMQHQYQLSLKYEEQERVADLMKKKVDVMCVIDKHGQEMKKLHLENALMFMDVEDKKRKNERSIFGAIKDGFAGKEHNVSLSQRAIEDEISKERGHVSSFFQNMIDSTKNKALDYKPYKTDKDEEVD